MIKLLICTAILNADFSHSDVRCAYVETERRPEVVCMWMGAQAEAKQRVVTRCVREWTT